MKNLFHIPSHTVNIKELLVFLVAIVLMIVTLTPVTASAYLCWNTGVTQGQPLMDGGRNGYPGESLGETRECSPEGYQQLGDDIGNSPAYNTMFTCVYSATYCGAGLPPPTPVSASAGSCGTINVSWGGVSGATSYEVRTNGGPAINVGNVTSMSRSSLNTGQTYSFEIRAVSGGITSAWSGSASAVAPAACPSVQLWFN